jgi:hypothetical protein
MRRRTADFDRMRSRPRTLPRNIGFAQVMTVLLDRLRADP